MYEWRDHTAELELAIEAPTLEQVFEEALRAFGELVGREEGGELERHDVRAEGADLGALLAAWIEELIFLAESRDLVPERTVALALSDGKLEAVVEGRRDRPAHLVKAVTYHGLSVEQNATGWRATLVLDV